MMTYERMRELIKGGQSVVLDGRVIAKMDDLPPEEEFVADKPDQRAKLRRQLTETIRRSQDRLDRLNAMPETPRATGKPPPFVMNPDATKRIQEQEKELADLRRQLQERDEQRNDADSLAAAVQDKDAEIERLKGELAKATKGDKPK